LVASRQTISPIYLSRIPVNADPLAFMKNEAWNSPIDIDCLMSHPWHDRHEGK
jgi:hypothetical protein